MAVSWVVDMEDELSKLNTENEAEIWNKHSIYRVPIYLAENSKTGYKPQVVSFGPYHHGDKNLQAMEEHKQRALLHILKSTNKTIKEYVGAIKLMEQELRDCYDRLEEPWLSGDGKFLQLMILDGCFMLEILRTANGISNTYAYNDPIFSSHGKLNTVPFIRRDMLMLENQLPLMLLEKLMELEGKKTVSINKLVLSFISPQLSLPPSIPRGLHVIDVYRTALLLHGPPKMRGGPTEPQPDVGGIVRSANELHEAGVRFKESKTGSFRDITFQNGVLTLPVVMVDDTTEPTLLNLMAFERLHAGAGNEVTSYVFFMDNLIDSAADVSLLHSKGIIQNAIGSDKAVAKIFNMLSKDTTLDPDSELEKVQTNVNQYCRKKWNAWRANLIHTYFRSPWALLSLAAAIFLLVLTVLQTVYSIYPYYKSSR